MKKFFKKRSIPVALAAYACVIGAIGYFVIRPILGEIGSRRDQIQEEIAKQEDQKKQIAELPVIQAQYQTVQSSGSAMNVLLDTNDAVTLIEEIEQLAKNTNNEVKITISQADSNSKDAIVAQKAAASEKQPGDKSVSITDNLPSKQYLEMNIALTGQYNDIVDFIEKIENMRYYSDIISFQIKRDDSVKNAVATSSGIISSPFAGQDKNAPKQVMPLANSDQKLAAVLDVAFYLKQ